MIKARKMHYKTYPEKWTQVYFFGKASVQGSLD